MQRVMSILSLLLITAVFTGCYKQIPREAVTPVEIKVVALDAAVPLDEEADIIVTTHTKKASYLLSPRTAESPYTFYLMIDGKGLKEILKGVQEVESDMNTEKGEGIHYVLKKRIRLKPGWHEIVLRPEDKSSVKVKVEIGSGKVYSLRFEPLYGPRKFGLRKTFQQGLVDYEVYMDGNRIMKE